MVLDHYLVGSLCVPDISFEQAQGPWIQFQADLTIGSGDSVQIQQCDVVPGGRFADTSRLQRLARTVAEEADVLRLAEAIADCDPPSSLDLVNHLCVERLAAAHDFPQLHRIGAELLEHADAPDGRWRAKCGDAT